MNFEVLGWLGSIILQLHTIPQAVQCYQQKHAEGFSKTFLLMWVTGCFLMLIYTIPTGKAPLIINYFLNAFTGSFISYYKFRKVDK